MSLHDAIRKQPTSMVIELLDKETNLDEISSGYTLLHLAIEEKRIPIIKELVSRGANLETRRNGRTPLIIASSNTIGDEKIVEILLIHGADVNAADNGGWTALHHAVWSSNPPLVIVLLKHGANIHQRNNKGQSSLDLTQFPMMTDLLNLYDPFLIKEPDKNDQ